MKVRVEVFLKPGVLDVQGKAIEAALAGLGFKGVSDVRVGRVISFDSGSDDKAASEADARQMAERLLANPVIESFKVEVA
jgi:phosphoribosylformylglycinamidine synthase